MCPARGGCNMRWRRWGRCHPCCVRMPHAMAPMGQVPSPGPETASVRPPVPILRAAADSFSGVRAKCVCRGSACHARTVRPRRFKGAGDGTCPIGARCRTRTVEHAASPCCARSTLPPQPESRTAVEGTMVAAASTVRKDGAAACSLLVVVRARARGHLPHRPITRNGRGDLSHIAQSRTNGVVISRTVNGRIMKKSPGGAGAQS